MNDLRKVAQEQTTLNTMERPLSTGTKSTTALHDPPVPVRAKLAAAWTWPRTSSPSTPDLVAPRRPKIQMDR